MSDVGNLIAPVIPPHLPKSVQWLGGQGIGAWFQLTREKENYRIQRYSPSGKEECSRVFVVKGDVHFNIEEEFEFTYPSHCAQCTILQKGKNITFDFIEISNN